MSGYPTHTRSLGHFDTCHGCHCEIMPAGAGVGVPHVAMTHPDGRLWGLVVWCMDCRPDRVAWEAEQAAWWKRFHEGVERRKAVRA